MPRTTERNTVDLNELFDAWDKETGDGRDPARARQICHDYIAENPDDFAEFDALAETLTPEEVRDHMVDLVDKARFLANTFREGGMEDEAVRADAHKLRLDVWIMSRIDPQNIGGVANVTLQLPQVGG